MRERSRRNKPSEGSFRAHLSFGESQRSDRIKRRRANAKSIKNQKGAAGSPRALPDPRGGGHRPTACRSVGAVVTRCWNPRRHTLSGRKRGLQNHFSKAKTRFRAHPRAVFLVRNFFFMRRGDDRSPRPLGMGEAASASCPPPRPLI